MDLVIVAVEIFVATAVAAVHSPVPCDFGESEESVVGRSVFEQVAGLASSVLAAFRPSGRALSLESGFGRHTTGRACLAECGKGALKAWVWWIGIRGQEVWGDRRVHRECIHTLVA
jgi:hypothetical protein